MKKFRKSHRMPLKMGSLQLHQAHITTSRSFFLFLIHFLTLTKYFKSLLLSSECQQSLTSSVSEHYLPIIFQQTEAIRRNHRTLLLSHGQTRSKALPSLSEYEEVLLPVLAPPLPADFLPPPPTYSRLEHIAPSLLCSHPFSPFSASCVSLAHRYVDVSSIFIMTFPRLLPNISFSLPFVSRLPKSSFSTFFSLLHLSIYGFSPSSHSSIETIYSNTHSINFSQKYQNTFRIDLISCLCCTVDQSFL